jgi:transposase
MRAKIYIHLSKAEQSELESLVRFSSNHRIRQRSQALLWSHSGKDRNTIATLFSVKADTVSSWLNRWTRDKTLGLSDLARIGRPSKFNAEEKKR